MNEFIMLVGLPASGKSTYAENLRQKGFHVHSSDKIREELTGDINSQDKNTEVFRELHKRIKSDLQNGISCVYDATNINMRRRKAFLDEIKKYDCKKTCVLFLIPIEVCKERNQNRERKVPNEVFDKMLKQFQCPYYYEGWDNILVMFLKNYEFVRPIVKTFNFEQYNSHHSRDLFDHMFTASRWIWDHATDRRNVLLEAALNHDTGKIYTQDFRDAKGNPTTEAHYYGHENYSAYLFLLSEFSLEFYEDRTTFSDSLYIACLINWHMRPYTAWKQSEKSRERDRKLIGEEMYQDLMLLHEADLAAH